MATPLPVPPAYTRTSNVGACPLCPCQNFQSNRWRPSICQQCQHAHERPSASGSASAVSSPEVPSIGSSPASRSASSSLSTLRRLLSPRSSVANSNEVSASSPSLSPSSSASRSSSIPASSSRASVSSTTASTSPTLSSSPSLRIIATPSSPSSAPSSFSTSSLPTFSASAPPISPSPSISLSSFSVSSFTFPSSSESASLSSVTTVSASVGSSSLSVPPISSRSPSPISPTGPSLTSSSSSVSSVAGSSPLSPAFSSLSSSVFSPSSTQPIAVPQPLPPQAVPLLTKGVRWHEPPVTLTGRAATPDTDTNTSQPPDTRPALSVSSLPVLAGPAESASQSAFSPSASHTVATTDSVSVSLSQTNASTPFSANVAERETSSSQSIAAITPPTRPAPHPVSVTPLPAPQPVPVSPLPAPLTLSAVPSLSDMFSASAGSFSLSPKSETSVAVDEVRVSSSLSRSPSGSLSAASSVPLLARLQAEITRPSSPMSPRDSFSLPSHNAGAPTAVPASVYDSPSVPSSPTLSMKPGDLVELLRSTQKVSISTIDTVHRNLSLVTKGLRDVVRENETAVQRIIALEDAARRERIDKGVAQAQLATQQERSKKDRELREAAEKKTNQLESQLKLLTSQMNRTSDMTTEMTTLRQKTKESEQKLKRLETEKRNLDNELALSRMNLARCVKENEGFKEELRLLRLHLSEMEAGWKDLQDKVKTQANSADNFRMQLECKICCDNRVQVVCLPCGHACLCQACCNKMSIQGKLCPVCRRKVDAVHAIYLG